MKVKKKGRSHKHDVNRLMSTMGSHTLRVHLHVTETKLIPDETRHGMKKFLFKREFHPGMKFNLKENLPLSMKTCNEIYY